MKGCRLFISAAFHACERHGDANPRRRTVTFARHAAPHPKRHRQSRFAAPLGVNEDKNVKNENALDRPGTAGSR
jgi:hypothetical protein